MTTDTTAVHSLKRAVPAALALFFGALGLAFWFAPEQAAASFDVEYASEAGLAAVRTDFGGLFAGLALLCGAAAFNRRREWALAAAAVLSAIVVGRLIGFVATGVLGGVELAVELGALAALAWTLRVSDERSSTPFARRAAWVIPAVVLVALGAAAMSPSVERRLYDLGATKVTGAVNREPLQDDALRVAVCGSSAPLPSAKRAKACVAVFAGGKFYVVDAGPESVENLVRWNVPFAALGGVFLTHFHSDHIGDLGELQLQSWANARPEQMKVWGPPGVQGVVDGFNTAYRLDQGYRTAHHGENVMPSAAWGMVAQTVELVGVPSAALDRTAVVFDDGALKVTAIEVNHAPVAPAYAYRFDYKGRSVVVTGDMKYHPPLATASLGADVLVSEATSNFMTRSLSASAANVGVERTASIMKDLEDYHITPEQAAKLANDAGVKLLVYYHLLPAPDTFLVRRLFTNGVNEVRDGDWTIADDGSLYTLPLDSKEVHIGRMTTRG